MTPFVRLWICLSVFASFAGWALSALGQLNRTGYTVGFAIFILFLVWQWKPLGLVPGRINFRRFRRPLPFCFAALAALIFLGGVLYPPSNYTGLNYREARVLQWLAHDHWFWIHTANYRMNDRACGIEWLTAPLMLFTKSDRALFLINFIPFLLLPGLIFSVFTRLGVRARVAWQWMWLLPTGYNFLLQAGSVANDTFPAIYALAAIDFAVGAWQSRRTADLRYSILAIALMIGAKPSNLPLLLPWVILVSGVVPLLRRQPIKTALVILVAAMVSFLPTAILNIYYCGDWSGAKLEPSVMVMKDPWVGLWGNTFQMLLVNFVPPIFPLAGWWNTNAPLFMPQSMVMAANNFFDTGFFVIGELPTEDWAGLGLGISSLLVATLLSSRKIYRKTLPKLTIGNIPFGLAKCVLLAAWIALAAYCMKSGMTTTARLVAPYYPLLLPLLLLNPATSHTIRRKWWHWLTSLVLFFAFAVVILVPDRPLWPAKTILSKIHIQYPDSHLINRALNVYTLYSKRWDSLADVRDLLPPGIKVVGFLSGLDDCDISLWRPFGERRVEHILATDLPAQIREHAEYVVVSGSGLETQGISFEAWQHKTGAELLATTNITLKINSGAQTWFVVRLNDNPAK